VITEKYAIIAVCHHEEEDTLLYIARHRSSLV
jgi:hypothetical protein